MFTGKVYEDRLASWAVFRSSLRALDSAIVIVNEQYKDVELHSQRYDPWDYANWPSPWTLIFDNKYCLFTKTLGMCYTLQLGLGINDIELFIVKDEDLQTQYVGKINNYILGLNDDVYEVNDVIDTLSILNSYTLAELN